MVIRGYKWLFRKVLDRRLSRDIALFGITCTPEKPGSIAQINRTYLKQRADADLESATVEATQHKWLLRILNAAFVVNLASLLYRVARPATFEPHYSEIASLGVTLATLGVVFWGVSVVHGRLSGMMTEDEAAKLNYVDPKMRRYRERNTIVFVNALTTITVALLAIALIPNALPTLSLVPVVFMTVVLATQRSVHRIISEDLISTELREYIQCTQALYTDEVRDQIFFRELEGTPTSISYLLHLQTEPVQDNPDDQ